MAASTMLVNMDLTTINACARATRLDSGGPKRLAPVTVQELNIGVQDCKHVALAAGGMTIRVGATQAWKKPSGLSYPRPPILVKYGASAGVEVEMAKAAGNGAALEWPSAGPSCVIIYDARRIGPGAVRSYTTASRSRMAKCLQQLAFGCSDAFVARARASYYINPRPGAAFSAGPWSSVFKPNIACTNGNSTRC